jgi:hypothetical protein
MPTLTQARLSDAITRAEMAKVMVAFIRHSEDDPEYNEGEDEESRYNNYSLEAEQEISLDDNVHSLVSSLQPMASAQNDVVYVQNDKCTAFSDLSTAPLDLQSYIIQACQLGLMGLETDGTTPKKAFDPNETITLAEVATTISRLLR